MSNKDIKQKRLGNIYSETAGEGFAGNVWSKEFICPTITTMQGGGRQPMIIEDFYANRDVRVYDKYSPSLRSERSGLKVVEDGRNSN